MISLHTYLFVGLVIVIGSRCLRRGDGIGQSAVIAAGAMILVSAFLPTLVFSYHRYLHDLWVALEQANKSRMGLVASVDYVSVIGPVYDWVLRGATAIRPLSATTIPLANAIMGVVVLAACVLLLRRQLSATALGLVTLIAVAAAVSPRENDTIFAETSASWLAPYNRWGFALVVSVAMALACPPGRRGWPEALGVGTVIAALAMLKVTFGAASVVLLLVSAALRIVSLRDAAAVVVGLVATLAAFEGLTGQVTANLADLQRAAGLEESGLRTDYFLYQLGEAVVWAGVAIAAAILLKGIEREDPDRRALMMLVVVAMMGCGLLMQNHPLSETPLYACLPLIAATWTGVFRARPLSLPMPRREEDDTEIDWGTGGAHERRMRKVLILGLLCMALYYPVRDLAAMTDQLAEGPRAEAMPGFAGTALADFRLHRRYDSVIFANSHMANELDFTAQTTGLLRALGADAPCADGTIMTLGFANPFPMIFGLPSPRRSQIFMDYERSYSATVHTPPEVLLGDVDYAIRVKDRHGGWAWSVYGDYVRAQYRMIHDDDRISLYTRCAPGAAAPALSATTPSSATQPGETR